MIHIRQALYVPSLKNAPVPVSIDDRLAAALVVGMRHEELDSMLVVVDVQAVGRAVHEGHPATIAMPTILCWAYEALPADLMDGDVTLVHVNFDGQYKYMRVGASYRVNWTPVSWPDCERGSLKSLSGAHPGYASVLAGDLEELLTCVQ